MPELLRRAPGATLLVSPQARLMLKGLFDPADLAGRIAFVGTGDCADLGDRQLAFLNTPYLHWPDTQCTWLAAEGVLFSADFLGCHYCDTRLFNDAVGDFRFSFEYYYAHIMRPFRTYVHSALDLIEPLPLRIIAPGHGPILRHQPRHFSQVIDIRLTRTALAPLRRMRPGGEVERADDLEYFFGLHCIGFQLVLLVIIAGNTISPVAGDQSELLETS